MKPKYLFLDIDAVLNDRDIMDQYMRKDPNVIVWRKHGLLELAHTTFVGRLQDIIQRTNCTVVGISSWFSHPEDKDEIGMVLDIPISDVVDNTGGGSSRVRSVLRYLKSHDYESFVIIDDIPNFTTDNVGLDNHHVQPTGSGLTEELANKAARILGPT